MMHSEPGTQTLGVEQLVKTFGRKIAVNGITFSMTNGEVVGLLGPNGAGKTTTFYMIVGFITPTSGKISLNDKDISKLPMYLRAQEGIAYLPQEPSVFRKLTVEDNIMAILETRSDLNLEQRKEKLEILLGEFGIVGIRKQMAYTLSGGERRRTEIARALAIEPNFLLLDEPFAGIDPIAINDIKKIIRQLASQGIGILITDHNVRETLEITTRAYIIYQGQILVDGSRHHLVHNPLARRFYLGDEFHLASPSVDNSHRSARLRRREGGRFAIPKALASARAATKNESAATSIHSAAGPSAHRLGGKNRRGIRTESRLGGDRGKSHGVLGGAGEKANPRKPGALQRVRILRKLLGKWLRIRSNRG